MPNGVAYIAEGKLYLHDGAGSPRLLESPFVQQQLDRAAQARERAEWKGDNQMLWGSMSGPSAMGGRFMAASDGEVRRVRMTALTAGEKPGQLLYALQSGSVGGLFIWDEADKSERRLFHKNQFMANDLSIHSTTGTVALSVVGEAGTSNIATMELTGRGLREITEGDSLDESPAWEPPGEAGKKVLVYQSAGVGRNASGFPVSRGPYAILRLDFARGDVETLVEDDRYDHLLPRVMADGSLLFIRRPYEPGHKPASPWKMALDALLFPFRLVLAFVHFFNWFSMVFRSKPLLTAGGPKREQQDSKYLMLWGKLVEAEKVRRGGGDREDQPLVPRTWELVRRSVDGAETTVAAGVLAYDVAGDGTVIYSNGTSIHRLKIGGTAERLCAGVLIERVAAVRSDRIQLFKYLPSAAVCSGGETSWGHY